jgi:DNA-binding transcriptional regulator YiaG
MQSDVAKIIGVSEESIWNWEHGRTKPSKKNLEIINAFITASLNRYNQLWQPSRKV